ncbi:MAG: glycosyltransferase [Candidatus Hodarchaeales archaeon]|jgi:glycosyltransferase involved in cell wall biosynthesis
MKVTLVTEAFGGIATYSKLLLQAVNNIKRIKASALWLFTPQEYQDEKIEGYLPFAGTFLKLANSHQFKDPLIRKLKQDPSDIVHFQYDVSIFPSRKGFIELLEYIRKKTTKKVIITLHSIYVDLPSVRMNNDCLELVDAFLVHQENAKDFLVSKGLDHSKIFVIPHGTAIFRLPPEKKGFFKTEAFKIAMIGFLKKSKAFEKALSSLSDKKGLEIIVAGMVKEPEVVQQITRLQQQAKAIVTLIPQFLTDQELAALISEADCLIQPYEQEYFSSSGILHLSAGMNKIILVSSCPKFRELTQRIPFCEVKDKNYGKHIDTLRNSPGLAAKLRKEIKLFAHETSWPIVAEKTVALYQSVLSEKN